MRTMRRSLELLSLAIRAWIGLVPGLILGLYGLVTTVVQAKRSPTFWLAVLALSIMGVLVLVAYRALAQRDAAAREQASGHHYTGPVTINVGTTPNVETDISTLYPSRIIEGTPDRSKKVKVWDLFE